MTLPKSNPLRTKAFRTRYADDIIQVAIGICEERALRSDYLTSPEATRNLLTLTMSDLESERFDVLWLDSRHGILVHDTLFHGTIDGASVYPREVVKAGLKANAAACILVHNHPSGLPEPSQADTRITERLKAALALVDIRVLDHLVVAGGNTVSMAERGLM
jgi:DNA repair protein RadC